MDTNKEQQFISSHRGWILDRTSEGAYTGNLIDQLDWMQKYLDSYMRVPTKATAAAYDKAKDNFHLMAEGAGL